MDELETILDMHRESMGYGYECEPTPDLESTWDEFDSAAREALDDLGFDAERYDEDEPRGHSLASIVYHTITGAGVGLWEQDFAPYWRVDSVGMQRTRCGTLRTLLREWADDTGAGKITEALTECCDSQAPVPCPEIYIDGETVERECLGYEGLDVEVTINPEGGATAAPLSWCNSAGIELDPDRDRVRVTISVGDSRGAFVMEVERAADGQLRLSVPHPDDSFPHTGLTPLTSGGFYRVGAK